MPSEQLVRSCLYNWLGYGNLDSPVWFVGMEEGGAEIWSKGTRTLEESLALRSKFELAMDFRTVWEDLYEIPLSTFRRKGLTVWHFMAVFLSGMEGQSVQTDEIRNFVFVDKRLGRSNGNHFMCEFLPLPRANHHSMEGYESIWQTVRQYELETGPKRFDLIQQVLEANPRVSLLVSYDKGFTARFINHFRSNQSETWLDVKGKTYLLYRCHINDHRIVYLLSTPFFGNGQANYTGLVEAATRARRILTD